MTGTTLMWVLALSALATYATRACGFWLATRAMGSPAGHPRDAAAAQSFLSRFLAAVPPAAFAGLIVIGFVPSTDWNNLTEVGPGVIALLVTAVVSHRFGGRLWLALGAGISTALLLRWLLSMA